MAKSVESPKERIAHLETDVFNIKEDIKEIKHSISDMRYRYGNGKKVKAIGYILVGALLFVISLKTFAGFEPMEIIALLKIFTP